jgi:hypothetical protein
MGERVQQEHQFRTRLRWLVDKTATSLAVLSTVLVIVPLAAIFIYLII